MPKKEAIDKARTKAGRLIRVWNTARKKFSNEARQYTAVWIEDPDGGKERCWLLTDSDIARMEYRSERNKEDWTQKDFWTDLLD